MCNWDTKTLTAVCWTHLSLASHKRDIGKQNGPRSDAADRGVWSESTLFAISSEISTKYDKNKNQPDTPDIGNWPVRRVKVEDPLDISGLNALCLRIVLK